MAWGSDTEWTISSFGEPWRIWLVPPFERHEQGPSRAALVDGDNPLGALLYSGFDDAGAVSDDIAVPLLRIYDALTGRGVLQELNDPSHPTDDPRGLLRGFERELADTVYEAVELGRLRFERVVPGPWPFLDEERTIDVAAPQPIVEKTPPRPTTFIAVELVDPSGKPIRGRRYRIVLPSGDSHEGRFDETGAIRFDDIDPGDAQFFLLDVEGTQLASRAASSPAPAIPSPAAPVARTTIAIELCQPNGTPIGYEPYSIVLPDGNIRTGRLKKDGTVTLALDTEGLCRLTFPRLDSNVIRKLTD